MNAPARPRTGPLGRMLLIVAGLALGAAPLPAQLSAQMPAQLPGQMPATSLDGRPAIGQAIEMADLIEHYYRSPDAPAAIAALRSLNMARFLESESPNERTHGLAMLGAFFAHILRGNPSLSWSFVDAAVATGDQEKAMVAAIALASAGSAQTAAALDLLDRSGLLPPEVLAEARRMPPYPFPAMIAETHLDLDLFWVSFYATGDTLYVGKVVDALAYWTPENIAAYSSPYPQQFGPSENAVRRRALVQVFTAVTAREMLGYNAARHPIVLTYLRSRAAGRSDDVGEALRAVIAEVQAAAQRN